MVKKASRRLQNCLSQQQAEFLMLVRATKCENLLNYVEGYGLLDEDLMDMEMGEVVELQ
jgi:hypothetical protein